MLHDRKFPVAKKTDDLLADEMTRAAKLMFTEFELPKKIVSCADMNFIPDKLKTFAGS